MAFRSKVIEDLKDKRKADTVIAYHYVDFNDPKSLSPACILLNLFTQLLPRDGKWIKDFPDLVSRKDGQESPPVRIKDLCEFIRRASNYHKVIIAVDALDECNENREELLSHLRDLGAIEGISLFVTSRKEHDIQEIFQNLPCLSLNKLRSKLVVDIEAYIEDEFRKRGRLRRLTSELKFEIRDKLVEGADGM